MAHPNDEYDEYVEMGKIVFKLGVHSIIWITSTVAAVMLEEPSIMGAPILGSLLVSDNFNLILDRLLD